MDRRTCNKKMNVFRLLEFESGQIIYCPTRFRILKMFVCFLRICIIDTVSAWTLYIGHMANVFLKFDKFDKFSLFILQPEDHRPMWYIHTITGENRY